MNNQLHNDIWLYRIAAVSTIGAIVSALSGQSTSEVMVALGLAAIGGVARLLAPLPLNQ